ncbi:hypothetical protein ABFG93_05565 [Pseudalkalibacillus hwajinpoensis]|uniref:hypothetical protein n=1 Tax=Guptibacillus hwajinpoensis TaxID=208199 RepID=UPI00325B0BF4
MHLNEPKQVARAHSIIPSVLLDECASFTIPLSSSRSLVVSCELEHVFERLQEAKSPLLLLGKGVHLSKAYEHVQWLAEHWQIPVVTTPGGTEAFQRFILSH